MGSTNRASDTAEQMRALDDLNRLQRERQMDGQAIKPEPEPVGASVINSSAGSSAPTQPQRVVIEEPPDTPVMKAMKVAIVIGVSGNVLFLAYCFYRFFNSFD